MNLKSQGRSYVAVRIVRSSVSVLTFEDLENLRDWLLQRGSGSYADEAYEFFEETEVGDYKLVNIIVAGKTIDILIFVGSGKRR